jgi:hypothetical protein
VQEKSIMVKQKHFFTYFNVSERKWQRGGGVRDFVQLKVN